MSEEKPEVMALGEDGEMWLVLHAIDNARAIEAVREYERVEAAFMMPHGELFARFRSDLVWRHGGSKPSRFEDDELLYLKDHFEKYGAESKRIHPFAGHLVSTSASSVLAGSVEPEEPKAAGQKQLAELIQKVLNDHVWTATQFCAVCPDFQPSEGDIDAVHSVEDARWFHNEHVAQVLATQLQPRLR